MISEIMDNSPAKKAGLSLGDVIVQIDQKKIVENEDLIHTIEKEKIGQKTTVVYLHNGKIKSAKVTIGEKAN